MLYVWQGGPGKEMMMILAQTMKNENKNTIIIYSNNIHIPFPAMA